MAADGKGKRDRAAEARREAELVARLIHEFLDSYAPTMVTQSAHTLKSYRDAIGLYLDYLESRGVGPERLSREHFEAVMLEGYVAWLKEERGNSNDTCNVRLSSVRRLIRYMASRDPGMLYLEAESKGVSRLGRDKTRVSSMSEGAVAALLAEPDASTAVGRRDLTFLTLVYSTACRLDEARTLAAENVRLEGPKPHIVVRGKGGKPRAAYLLPKVSSMLRAYMSEVLGPDPAPGAWVFPSPSRDGEPISSRALDKRIKKYAKAAHEKCPDVPECAHMHQLRHSKATHWVAANDLNIVEVQHLLGHEQLTTTMVYVDAVGPLETGSLATLEDEQDAKLDKRWKEAEDAKPGLREMCGLKGAHPNGKR